MIALAALCFALFASAQDFEPVLRPKPARTELADFHRTDAIAVKFRDGLLIRARDEALVDLGTDALADAQAVIARFSAGVWRRAFHVDEQRLDAMRATAQANLGRHIADLNLHFELDLPAGVSASAAIDALNALEIVELAEPLQRPCPPPVPPNFFANQGYLSTAPSGLNTSNAWFRPGGTGANTRICDVEYSWNFAHQDLPAMTLVGPAPVDPFNDMNHGTAVVGELASLPNGWGTTGGSYSSPIYVAAANTASGYNVAAGINNAASALSAGDVILIEQQAFGPGSGYVPVEWVVANYNAIVTAVGNGIHVVEAAGNGSENLDAAIYGGWFATSHDSGAIMVGAGGSPTGSSGDRSRLWFSNYGATVDVQGWGENVVTAGYGDLYSAEGVNLRYTATFGGTSSASPTVAAAVAVIASIHQALHGSELGPAPMRAVLSVTGSPQLSGTYPASQNIGPRPDVAAAITAQNYGPATWFCTGDGLGASTCPCGNTSQLASIRGCANSTGVGAMLAPVGVASIASDTVALLGTGMPGGASALVYQGTTQLNGGIGTYFGDGLRCVGGTLLRFDTNTTSANGFVRYPEAGQQPVHVKGLISSPGTRMYQIWYRNAPAFCTASTFNLSNGVNIAWGT